MKPIPRKLLIHTVAHKANPVSNGWGETYATEWTLYRVRLEPSSKIVKGRDNTELQLAATLFYDSANSRPRDVTFAPGDLIVFDGTELSVQTVEKVYDDRTLHHIEVGLI